MFRLHYTKKRFMQMMQKLWHPNNLYFLEVTSLFCHLTEALFCAFRTAIYNSNHRFSFQVITSWERSRTEIDDATTTVFHSVY